MGAPVGTIALLFTDIEGSARLATELGPAWPGVLAEHQAVVGGAIAEQGGFVDGTEGDAFAQGGETDQVHKPHGHEPPLGRVARRSPGRLCGQ
jgi:class 3 adenylate cyclase